jgi:beta-galactosidase
VERCADGRYLVVEPGSGRDEDDGSGLVKDTRTGLTWTRQDHRGHPAGQSGAQSYCESLGMRLPTKDEAKGIAGDNRDACAFPFKWGTWTSTAGRAGRAWVVGTHGTSFEVEVDHKNVTLCVR